MIDSSIPLPMKRLRDKNIPAVVEIANAANVVASDTRTVKIRVLR